MMNETSYTKEKTHSRMVNLTAEWSAPYVVDGNEIYDRINSFNLVGRKIKDGLISMRAIGISKKPQSDFGSPIAVFQ